MHDTEGIVIVAQPSRINTASQQDSRLEIPASTMQENPNLTAAVSKSSASNLTLGKSAFAKAWEAATPALK